MLAAASGNILSSIVFVPKDMVKQQMQVCANATMCNMRPILATKPSVCA